MAKNYLSADNSRGGAVTAAEPTFAHIRGWDAGVEVQTHQYGGAAGRRFDVRATDGSNGHRSVPLLTVSAGENGDAPLITLDPALCLALGIREGARARLSEVGK